MRQIMALSNQPNSMPELLKLDRPCFERGDTEFFDPASTERYQIRPLISSDLAPGYSYGLGSWMLVVTTKSGAKIRSSTPLPAHLRANTPANALAVYRRLVRKQPNFEKLVQICDSAPKPPA